MSSAATVCSLLRRGVAGSASAAFAILRTAPGPEVTASSSARSALGRAHAAQRARRGRADARGAAARPPFAAIQDVLQRRHRAIVERDLAERFDGLRVDPFVRALVVGVRQDVEEQRRGLLVAERAERLHDRVARVRRRRSSAPARASDTPRSVPTCTIARSASRCTCASESSSIWRRSGSAASPARPRNRSIAARRTAGLRELFNSLAYSRAAGPNETRMSRRRRTMRGVVFAHQRVRHRLDQRRADLGAHLLGDRELRVRGLLHEHRQVADHRAFDQLGHARGAAGAERRRSRSSRRRRPLRAAATRAGDRRRARADRCWRPRCRARWPTRRDAISILSRSRISMLIERADVRVADRREPGADAHRRVVADLVDVDRLRLRRRQLARVVFGHELRVRVRHQHFRRARPHAFELRIVLEERRGLLGRRGEDVLLLRRIRNEGLKRGREAAARAAILDDVVDEELGEHLVGQARLQLAGEVHARAARSSRQRRRIRDQRQQHVGRHLRRGAGHLVQAPNRALRACAPRRSWRGRASARAATCAAGSNRRRWPCRRPAGVARTARGDPDRRRAPSCSAWWAARRCSPSFLSFRP